MYKEDQTIIKTQKEHPIGYTILHVTSFFLSGWRDVRTQKSRLKYEINYDLCYKLQCI